MRKTYQLRCLFIPSVLILIADQLSKLVITHTPKLHYVQIMPSLNFSLSYNRGAAFGILGQADGWQRWIFIAIAVFMSAVIYYWTMRLNKKDKWEIVSLGLILGGALGNLIDRIYLGHVVDFIDFYISNWHWYTFNIADIGISIGTFMLCVYTLFVAKN